MTRHNGIKQKMRLSAALLVAAGAGLRHPWSALPKLRAALRVWISGFSTTGIVDQAHYDQRLFACRNCPIFYAPLQTCGSPLRRATRGLGCYCNVEAMAWFAEKRCYLDEIYGDEEHYGWNEPTSTGQGNTVDPASTVTGLQSAEGFDGNIASAGPRV
jgi:hypothetical protein